MWGAYNKKSVRLGWAGHFFYITLEVTIFSYFIKLGQIE